MLISAIINGLMLSDMDISNTHHLPAAGLALLLWGGWACLANQAAGIAGALRAGLLQGTTSAIITLLMATVVTRLFMRLPLRPLAILLPPCLVVSLSTTALYLIHSFGQTPNLWLTILPPSGLAFAFCLYLTLRLASQPHLPSDHSDTRQ